MVYSVENSVKKMPRRSGAQHHTILNEVTSYGGRGSVDERGRQVLLGNVVALVIDTTCVLAHNSTAIGLSVIYRKPLITLDSKSYHRSFRRNTKIYAQRLDFPMVCFSLKYQIDPAAPIIDEKKYKK